MLFNFENLLELDMHPAPSNYNLLERVICALNRQESLSHFILMSCARSCEPHFEKLYNLTVYDIVSAYKCKLLNVVSNIYVLSALLIIVRSKQLNLINLR